MTDPDHSRQLVDDFLTTSSRPRRSTASYLGLTEYDEQLDDLSADAFRKRDADAAEWLERFEAAGERA